MQSKNAGTSQDESRSDPAVSLLQSPLGRIGGLLLEAINARDEDRLREFLDAYTSETLREERPEDGWLSFLRRVREQSGGLEHEDMAVLLEESELEGFWMVRRLVSQYLSGANRFDAPGEALFGAYRPDLIGLCGLNRDPYLSDPGIGRVRRLYVSPRHRRCGVGRSLVEAVIQEARRHYRVLVLRTNDPRADAFYQTLGFSVAPRFEHATHWLQLSERNQG